ncbi:hypothetical protein D5S17_26660 [Pseudonocardiaceae bacterium YIM PH 21723]|nr:hypothetical protein D5S17_26660 [Pseudonocardiaceae bacterium YIM PH 21723]
MHRSLSKLAVICALVAPLLTAVPAAAATNSDDPPAEEGIAVIDACRYQAVFTYIHGYTYTVEGTFTKASGSSARRELHLTELDPQGPQRRRLYQVDACQVAKPGENLTKIQLLGKRWLEPPHGPSATRNDGALRDVATLPHVPTARPTNLAVTLTGPNEATFTWQPPAGEVTNYQVKITSPTDEGEVEYWRYKTYNREVSAGTLQYVDKLDPRAPEGTRTYTYTARTVVNGFVNDVETDPVSVSIVHPR